MKKSSRTTEGAETTEKERKVPDGREKSAFISIDLRLNRSSRFPVLRSQQDGDQLRPAACVFPPWPPCPPSFNGVSSAVRLLLAVSVSRREAIPTLRRPPRGGRLCPEHFLRNLGFFCQQGAMEKRLIMVKLYSHRDIEIVTRPPAATKTCARGREVARRARFNPSRPRRPGASARDKVFGFPRQSPVCRRGWPGAGGEPAQANRATSPRCPASGNKPNSRQGSVKDKLVVTKRL